jgi:putative tricarboxylic transport membrane protein
MQQRSSRKRWSSWLPLAVALAATAAIVLTEPADNAHAGTSAREVLGDGQLRIMAPAAPGGGWDQTSREMQHALRDMIGRTEVYNVTGAGGTIGLSQFVRFEGEPTQLMTTGAIMVGAVKANGSSYSLADTTPLARLTTDYEAIVVPPDSPLRSTADLAAAMRANLSGVSIAGGSSGGVEHILSGLLAKGVGRPPAEISYVAHSGGGETLGTLLSGRATIGIFGVSEIQPQIDAGAVRALAVSSPDRLPALPEVPTLREGGLDIELQNWRGVVAPKGISADQERALENLLLEMTRTDAWQQALRERGWGDATLAGPEFERFVRADQERVTQVLDEVGLG